MTSASVAFVEVGSVGHFQRMRSLISLVARRGIDAVVVTHPRFADDVTRLGGRFVDLYATHSLEEADDASVPLPCRSVSFAGHFGEEVADRVRQYEPMLVVADTFAVVGRLVAHLLDVPYVNVCAGHNAHPSTVLPELANDPRVAIGERCHEAVDILRDRHSFRDASPFSYADGLSPWLNIYCEPPEFLTPAEQDTFSPIAFFGSLPPEDELASLGAAQAEHAAPRPGPRHVFASCGTIVWRYYTDQALALLDAIASAIAARPGWSGQITVGNAPLGRDAIASLARPNVTVSSFVDQWAALAQADLFVTHHGLNSTHEAVYRQVPMVSYPFFGDQPAMATRCQELDLAVPLGSSPRCPVTADDVGGAFDELAASERRLHGGLRRALEWELDVVARRGEVVDQLLALG